MRSNIKRESDKKLPKVRQEKKSALVKNARWEKKEETSVRKHIHLIMETTVNLLHDLNLAIIWTALTRGGSIPETSRNTNRNKDLHEDELDADHSDAP